MRVLQVLGLSGVVMGCLGLFTVADDLDHRGEIFCVGGVLVAGVALLLDGSPLLAQRLPLRWVAAGIGVGEVVGAVMGQVPVGVGGGAILGAIGSAIVGWRGKCPGGA